MDIYNQQNEEVKPSYLDTIFHATLPAKEVHEYIYEHSFLFNRNDNFVIKLSFLDFEMDNSISIYKENRAIIYLTYRYADYIKILDEKNKVFEIISTSSEYNSVASKTILSLTGSPILDFHDRSDKEELRTLDVLLTDLMMLFDDFDEIQETELSKSYRFICKRFSEFVELNISPVERKLSLIIQSGDICLCSLELIKCDRILANLEKKKLYFTSGFNENKQMSYIECCLDLNEHLYLFIQPNSKPGLRGLG